MKLLTLLILFISITINALALEVIINPYEQIDYNEPQVYYIDDQESPCSCDCSSFEDNYFSRL